MPESASEMKLAETRARGAEVIQHGRFSDERKKLARELARAPGSYYVDPTDDADVIAGQGTIGLELVADVDDLDVVVAPIGGGGLIAGIAAAVKRLRPSLIVLGVEPVGSASMSASIRAGAPVALADVASIADGLLIREPGELPFRHVRSFVDEIVLVDEADILDAMRLLAERAKLIVEPSGAVALAAGLVGRVPHPRGDATNIAFVVSGGNVSLEPYAGWIGEPYRRFARS
jgi:threonine dehydratase